MIIVRKTRFFCIMKRVKRTAPTLQLRGSSFMIEIVRI